MKNPNYTPAPPMPRPAPIVPPTSIDQDAAIKALHTALGLGPDDPDYTDILRTVVGVLQQVTSGKGRDRHARGRDFDDQPILVIPRLLGGAAGYGFLIGQSIKKSEEALGLPPDRRDAEFRGAAVYLLAALIFGESAKP